MTAAGWATIVVGVIGFLGMAYSARLKQTSDRVSGLDSRAQQVLDKAMAWQDSTIAALTARVAALEAEVVACEVGRRADRLEFDTKLARLERKMEA